MNEFSKVVGYKVIYRNLFHFFTLTMKCQKERVKKKILLKNHAPPKILRNKLNQRDE